MRFAFREDRYAHEIWLADGAAWVRVLSSVEGSPLEPWPESPALQSLHQDTHAPDRPTALLVGMAGKSHYSLSAQLDPAAHSVRFDVACRAGGGEIGPLGSRYRCGRAVDFHDQRHAILAPDTPGRADLELDICQQLGAARIECSGDTIGVIAAQPWQSQRQTVRWGYTIVRRERSMNS